MSWEAQGDTVKLSIESPLKEVDGYDWKEVMSTIVSEGEKVVRSHYAIASFEVIDEPYYESESHQTGDIALSTRFQVKRDILLIAGNCDTTLVVIENNKVDGNKAIGLQMELELNGASTLGAVYIC